MEKTTVEIGVIILPVDRAILSSTCVLTKSTRKYNQGSHVACQLMSGSEGVVYSGCHSLSVELVEWSGDGDDHAGKNCDPWFAGKQCDPFFYLCVDEKYP